MFAREMPPPSQKSADQKIQEYQAKEDALLTSQIKRDNRMKDIKRALTNAKSPAERTRLIHETRQLIAQQNLDDAVRADLRRFTSTIQKAQQTKDRAEMLLETIQVVKATAAVTSTLMNQTGGSVDAIADMYDDLELLDEQCQLPSSGVEETSDADVLAALGDYEDDYDGPLLSFPDVPMSRLGTTTATNQSSTVQQQQQKQ